MMIWFGLFLFLVVILGIIKSVKNEETPMDKLTETGALPEVAEYAEKRQSDKIDTDGHCFAKAKARGQRTFTLVDQDRTSPKTIAFWIMENMESAPDAKLREALESALAMRRAKYRHDAD